ncbi:DNA-directed RNA polymerase alpha subunit [Candidatus Vidania fulgoroideae]|nr:DNA-directed RNA polymerase alpha subunit [Candidatus Vidania fulgoroideae]
MKLKIKKIKIIGKNEIKVDFKKNKKNLLISFLNIFRRISISDHINFSPYWVKINNISHEYGTINGVEEDTLCLINNIRRLIFRLENCKSITIKIKKKGLCFLKGEDFCVKGFCHVINKGVIVARIKEGKTLKIKINIRKTKKKKLYFFPKKYKKNKIYINSSVSNLKNFSFKVKENNESFVIIKNNGVINPLFFFLRLHKKFFLNFYKNEKYPYEKLFFINPKILKPINKIKNKVINNVFNNTDKPLLNFFIFKKNMLKFRGLKSNLNNVLECEFKKTGIFF